MFVINIDRANVDIPHRDRLTTGSAGFLHAELHFSKDWFTTNFTVWVYFASSTGLRLRKKLSDLLKEALFDCVWGESEPTISIPSVVTAEPGVAQIGFMAENHEGVVVIPTIWGTLGRVEESVLYGDVEVPDPDEPIEDPDDPTPTWKVGHGLKLVDRTLSVDTVSDFSGDNTLPMTAAGVYGITGNIEALLKTI